MAYGGTAIDFQRQDTASMGNRCASRDGRSTVGPISRPPGGQGT